MFRANDFGLGGRDPKTIDTVVFFHYPCKDGLTAAYCLRQAFTDEDKVVFLPANYTDDAWTKGIADVAKAFDEDTWKLMAGKTVFVADFSFPPNVLVAMAGVATTVNVYDHHKTFRERLVEFGKQTGQMPRAITHAGQDIDLTVENKEVDCYDIKLGPTNLQILFSDRYCGAYLINYFHLNSSQRTPDLDLFVNYIDDRDMWKWQFSNSKAFHAALDIANPKDLYTLGLFVTGVRADQIEFGKQILKYFESKVDELVKRAVVVTVSLRLGPGEPTRYQIPIVNAVDHISELGHALLVAHPNSPFSATYFDKDSTTRVWSLRGRDSDDFDVSAVAKLYGGGGHKKACGFRQTVGPTAPFGFLQFP